MNQKKHILWLQTQLPQWQASNLIDAQQASSIENFYPKTEETQWGKFAFSAFGALIFGLGIILFFAYNWQDMHRYLKLGVIFSSLIAAHGAAIWFDSKRHIITAESLALLATVLFGAAIWLISQIYHIDEHYPNAFMLWGFAALALAWARVSLLQAIAALGLLFCWGAMELFDFNHELHPAALVIFLSLCSLAVVIHSRWLMFLSLSASLFLGAVSVWDIFDLAIPYVCFATLVVLIVLAFSLKHLPYANTFHLAQFRTAISLPSFAWYLIGLYIFSFEHQLNTNDLLTGFDSPIESLAFYVAAAISLITPLIYLLIRALKHSQFAAYDLHLIPLFISGGLLFWLGSNLYPVNDMLVMILVNLLFLSHALLFIIHGSKQQRGWEVAIGCLLFTVLVFTRYTDLFDSLLVRSGLFLVLGTGLFAVGTFYKSHHKVTSEQKETTA